MVKKTSKKKWKKKANIEKVSVSKKEKLEDTKNITQMLMFGQAVIDEGLDITEKDVDEQIAFTEEQLKSRGLENEKMLKERITKEAEELMLKMALDPKEEGVWIEEEEIKEDHPSGALEDEIEDYLDSMMIEEGSSSE